MDGVAEGRRAVLYEACEGRRWPNCSGLEASTMSSSCEVLPLAVCGRFGPGRERMEGESPAEAGDLLGSKGRGDAGVADDGEATPDSGILLLLFGWCLEVLETGLDSESGSGAAFLRPNIMIGRRGRGRGLAWTGVLQDLTGGSAGPAQTQPFHVCLPGLGAPCDWGIGLPNNAVTNGRKKKDERLGKAHRPVVRTPSSPKGP